MLVFGGNQERRENSEKYLIFICVNLFSLFFHLTKPGGRRVLVNQLNNNISAEFICSEKRDRDREMNKRILIYFPFSIPDHRTN